MLSKCANPDCTERFLYLHQGKLFYLMPTPEVQALSDEELPPEERFWLCDRCSKRMTLVWGGTQVKLVTLLPKLAAIPALVSEEVLFKELPKTRATGAASRNP